MPTYTAVTFFNDWLGGSARTSPPRADLEQRSREHLPMMDGYRGGDDLLRSAVELTVEATSVEAACEDVFAQLNSDDRPNGQSERSVSVGDLVALYQEGALVAVCAIETIGVRRLDDAEAEATSIAAALS